MATSFSHSEAVDLIKAALQSKAITLNSPGTTEAANTPAAKRDAAYLVTLLTEMTKTAP